ncbi:MAG: hypothetical protein U0414_29360 [Polyangiaceae bacterium]
MDETTETSRREARDAEPQPVVHRSPSGRVVVLRMEGRSSSEELTVYGRGGDVELAVRFTEAGPVLSFKGARLELESAGAVAVDCEDFEVRARRDVRVHAGRDLVQHASGEGRIEAERDLWIDGEMVLVNCDRERELEERAGRAAREAEEGG